MSEFSDNDDEEESAFFDLEAAGAAAIPTLSIVIPICQKRLCLLNVNIAVVIVAGCTTTTKVNGIVLTVTSNFMSLKPKGQRHILLPSMSGCQFSQHKADIF
jgi:hypothetical protein